MKVIFVCTGNTCRSPLAEGYLKSFGIKDLTVESRGIFADGSKVSENSEKVAQEYGFDISHHVSSPFSENDLNADMIITMSQSHLEMLKAIGLQNERLSVLANGIPDPFGANESVYRYCANQIFDSIDSLAFGGSFTDYRIVDLEKRHIDDMVRIEKEEFSLPWSKESILDSIKNGYIFFAAVDKNNRLIGYAGINTVLDEGYIANIAVDKEYRNKGIATLLINRLFVLARKKGLSFVTLEVRASNITAVSLYEKCGFKFEGRRKNFYFKPVEDAIIMTRRFS
ncbi:MAG: ribosomal protein S18-alanine N-acetyltransferase [Clostridia bacterium]|nr:ribosomal protein S18-alanine N-acetyltransferase [Clostridia bacterium]